MMRPIAIALLSVTLFASASTLAAPSGGGDGHDGTHVNWIHGFVGEREGVEPSIAYRPKGMPPPLVAQMVNAGLLFFILFWFGRKPLADGLKKRKERIVGGMEEAARMKAEASGQLEEHEKKLERIEEEIERVRREMREAAEAERARILEEAKERRVRLERDAKILVEQELKAAREALVRETVQSAVESARELVAKELTPADHDRLAQEYVELLRKTPISAPGGRA